eukprot:Gb_04463 [translate_table: standard]
MLLERRFRIILITWNPSMGSRLSLHADSLSFRYLNPNRQQKPKCIIGNYARGNDYARWKL